MEQNTDSSEEKNLNQNPEQGQEMQAKEQENSSTLDNSASENKENEITSETPDNDVEVAENTASDNLAEETSGSNLDEEIISEIPEMQSQAEEAKAEESKAETDLSTSGIIASQAEDNTAGIEAATEVENSEEDQTEEEHHDESEEETDFSAMSKDALLQYIIASTEHQDERNINKKVQAARGEFNKMVREERQQALESWLAEEEGREEKDFAWEDDELVNEFNTAFKNYKKRRHDYINSINKQKEDNLQAKKDIIEKLKSLTEQDEDTQSFNEFKKLQDEWRKLGHVPIAEAENIWNSYNHYVDKFFERRSLYTEFKELDRKRNFTAKESVVERIEALINLEDMNETMRLLKNLQEEWRHIGPVPRESMDAINQRYKDAVIQLYDKREKFSEELQKRREQNFDAKLALLEKIEEIAGFEGKNVQDWMSKNQELGQWIENWRAIGAVPSAKATDMKERFAAAIRKFNHSKNEFFRAKKKEKVDNLRLKTELAEKVEKLLEEENMQAHRKEVIKLQDEWKKVGPVPSRYSDKIWKRFQAACDAFFAKVNEKHHAQNQEQYENLEKKNTIIAHAEELLGTETVENIEQKIRELQAAFNEIGFVPFKEKDKVRKRFFDALNAVIQKFGGKKESSGRSRNAEGMSYELMLQSWAQENGGQQRLNDEERKHQRDLKRIENEIATLENNMEFFRNSKTADTFKQNMEKQVNQLRQRMDELQEKIKMVRTAGRK